MNFYNRSKAYNIKTHKEQTQSLLVSFIYSYLSILELNERESDSPTQVSRHTIVRQETHILSKLLNAIREDLTKNEITQLVKHDFQKILAWFIIDYFSHNLDLIEQARKNFRPQNTDDEIVLAECLGP